MSECAHHVSPAAGLTCLALEHQGEESWLPPPELVTLNRLQRLSITGNDCSRWPLHGGDEVFSTILSGMPGLACLDNSECGMEALPDSLLTEQLVSTEHGGGAPSLLRLLAHGNQLEAGPAGDGYGGEAEVLRFPG